NKESKQLAKLAARSNYAEKIKPSSLKVINKFDKAPYYPGFHDDHHDNPLLTKKTKSKPIIWDIKDEKDEYPFVNKHPSFQEEHIILGEKESCPVYDTDTEEKEEFDEKEAYGDLQMSKQYGNESQNGAKSDSSCYITSESDNLGDFEYSLPNKKTKNDGGSANAILDSIIKDEDIHGKANDECIPLKFKFDDSDDDSLSQATNDLDVEGVFQEMGFLLEEAIDSYKTPTPTAESEGKDDYNDDTKTSVFKFYQRGDHKDVYLEEQTGMRCRLYGVVLLESKCVIPKLANITPDKSEMSEFEDVVRMSNDLSAVIQTIDAVKGALSVAKSWLTKSKPFLASDLGLMPVSNSLLRVDTLKNLVSESKSLKFPVEERSLLEDVLATFMQWETNAYSALDDAESLLNILDVGNLTLPMVTEYFLSRAVKISSMTYEPSDEDILYANGITFSNGLASMEYSVPSTLPVTFMDATERNHAPLQRCELIRVKMMKT
nr:lysine-specific demethylase 5D isoform X1 [Tanacetum cinerariifolium]